MDEDKVLLKIVQLEADVSDIKEKMETLATKEDIDKLYIKEDRLVSLLQTITTELASTNSALKRHDGYFEKIKNRFEKLETDVSEIQSKLQTA